VGQSLDLLDREIARLRALIGIDTQNTKAFAGLTKKISRDEAALAKLKRDTETATDADERIKELIQANATATARCNLGGCFGFLGNHQRRRPISRSRKKREMLA
jgi:hypothetical protein